MTSVRRFLPLGRVLIAAIAICATSAPARADLTLNFSQIGTGGGTFSQTVTNGSTGTTTVGDFTIAYTVHNTVNSNSTTATRLLSVDLTVTNNSTTGGNKKLSYELSATELVGPGNGAASLQSILTVQNASSPNGIAVGSTASYTDNTMLGSVSVNTPNFTSGTSSPALLSPTASIVVHNPYGLTALGSVISEGNGRTVTFTSEAQILGVPEPSGVIAAMAGLPCLGVLLGFVRRRRVAEPASVV